MLTGDSEGAKSERELLHFDSDVCKLAKSYPDCEWIQTFRRRSISLERGSQVHDTRTDEIAGPAGGLRADGNLRPESGANRENGSTEGDG